MNITSSLCPVGKIRSRLKNQCGLAMEDEDEGGHTTRQSRRCCQSACPLGLSRQHREDGSQGHPGSPDRCSAFPHFSGCLIFFPEKKWAVNYQSCPSEVLVRGGMRAKVPRALCLSHREGGVGLTRLSGLCRAKSL